MKPRPARRLFIVRLILVILWATGPAPVIAVVLGVWGTLEAWVSCIVTVWKRLE